MAQEGNFCHLFKGLGCERDCVFHFFIVLTDIARFPYQKGVFLLPSAHEHM